MLVWLLLGVAMGQDCVPEADRAWVFGSQHKTGTVMLDAVLRETTADVVHVNPEFLNPRHEVKDLDSFEAFHVTSFEDVPKGAIAFWNHVRFDSKDHFIKLTAWAKERGQDLRAVIMLRDPREIILSGYFYHLETDESWVHRPMENHSMFSQMARSCPPEISSNLLHPACVVQKYLPTGMSYQEMLHDLDTETGVVVEGLRCRDVIYLLNETYAAVEQLSDIARVYDLNQVTASSKAFDSAFSDMFSFLGVNNVSACVALAGLHDLHRNTGEGTTHAMPKTLSADRDVLRAQLSTNSWFLDNVDPIRRALHYTD